MSDSPSPFSLTYTEDDLRGAAARISRAQAAPAVLTPISPAPPDPVNQLNVTSVSLVKPSHPPMPQRNRVSREQRRRQVSEVLTQQEREFAARKLERTLPADVSRSFENRLFVPPPYASTVEVPQTQQLLKTDPSLNSIISYPQPHQRFSNKNYYDWDDLETSGSSPPKIHEATLAHRESCELCRLGLDFERKERERLALNAARPRLPSRSEHCQIVKRFADDYKSTFM